MTSPYEILDYRSQLTIHDADGMGATLVRKQRIRFLHNGVSAILDHAWGDGVLTAYYSNTAGTLEGSIKDDKRRHLVIGLKRRMHRGDILDFEVRRDVMAALTTTTAWLETAIDHPIVRLAVSVQFPHDRPCKSASLTTPGGGLGLPVSLNRAGGSNLRLTVRQPRRDIPYTVHWTW